VVRGQELIVGTQRARERLADIGAAESFREVERRAEYKLVVGIVVRRVRERGFGRYTEVLRIRKRILRCE
jgi:hypothetical protein